MKKAKFALALITLLSIAAGTFAYRAVRESHLFYTETTVNIGGRTFTYCTVPTALPYTTSPGGDLTIKASTTPDWRPCTAVLVVRTL